MTKTAQIQLYGRVFIKGEIRAVTGLHIGGSGGNFTIGGVDNPIILDPLTDRPYIPGSSLKGKMRSLTEKYKGQVTGQKIGKATIHACGSQEQYSGCPICNIYGIAVEADFGKGTRLAVRDVPLDGQSAAELEKAKTVLPFVEVKTEVAIDRVTAKSNPRPVARVPAGAVFGPMEMVYSLYDPDKDIDWLSVLLDGMELLEDDYLGGYGSRGSGKITFQNLTVSLKTVRAYRSPVKLGEYKTLVELSAASAVLISDIRSKLNGR